MALSQKIKNLDELALILQKLKNECKKIIHCHGVFDLIHPGHVRHFQAAKTLGDILVVTVTADEYVNKGPGRPVFTERLRAESIAALECVNYVAINFSSNAVELIKKLSPDIYVKGKDYVDATKDETSVISLERVAVESVGGRIHFTEEITFSSSSLINEYFEIYPESAGEFLKNFRQRYSADEVINKLKELKNLRVLLIGETILDEYDFVSVMGKSPKGIHIATEFIGKELYAGGVLACANHLASFCDNIDLITALGKRGSRESFIRRKLKPNIVPKFFYYPKAPTIIKRRFIDRVYFNKLFEVYIFEDELAFEVEEGIANYLADNVGGKDSFDLVLAVDYGHGLLTPRLIEILCTDSKFLAVNAQSNTASLGFNPITKYPKADYFCLGEPELHLAFQDKHADIRKLIESLSQQVSSRGVISVTRGPKGSIVYDAEKKLFYSTPALSQKVVDTIGAGDAFLSITSACVAKGFPKDMTGFIGNVVGSLAIAILGNKSSVETAPLFKFITALLK